MAQSHKLTWGAITLSEPNSTPVTDGWVIEAMSDSSHFGNPEAILDIVQSLLTDGTLAVIQRWDNREATIRLRVSAPSVAAGPALAAAESALMGEILRQPRPSPLVWTPPATDAAVSVFDVVAAELERDTSEGWDFEEAAHEYRHYQLTLRALPFARPSQETTIEALAPNPGTPTTSLIDDGTSATNWSASVENVGGAEQRRNLVRNPAFPDGVSRWIKDPSSGATLAHSSGYAYITHSSGSSQTHAKSWAFPVTAGNTYTVSADVQKPPNWPCDEAFVTMVWVDSSGVDGQPELGGDGVTPLEGSWTRASTTATAPAGTVSARVYIDAQEYQDNKVGLRFDNVLFEESGTSDPYFDGGTADTASVEYAWTGPDHDSQSVAAAVPTPAVVSGAVEVTGDRLNPMATAEIRFGLLRDAAASMASLPYLRATIDADATGSNAELTFLIDGVQADVLAIEPSATAGFDDHYFETGDFTTFEARWTDQAGEATLSVADLTATDTLPQLPKQRPRLVTVTGSAPTQAAVRLFDDTTGELGEDALIYTSGSDFIPHLRRDWLASSDTTTADTDMVSGSYNDIDTVDMVFRVPASEIEHGMYALMARMGVDAAGATVDWEVKLTDSAGADVVGSDRVLTGSVTYDSGPGALVFDVYHLDALTLPPVAAEGSQYVQITLSSTATVNVDEVWLFNLDDGALTWLRDEAETLRWVEVRSPELDAPHPAVYGSASGDGSDAADVSYLCDSFGVHRFTPGQTQIFTVVTTSDESKSKIDYYPRYHSHVETS